MPPGADDCITVTAPNIFAATLMGMDPGFSPDLLETDISSIDPWDTFSLGFIELIRLSIGDPTVGCNSLTEVRQAEASTQLGPRIFQVDIGDVVRINYGTGESELFIVISQLMSIKAQPVPGTCG